MLAVLLGGFGGCDPRPPLDPLTGDTGGPLSDNERATDVLRYELTLEVLPDRETIRGISSSSICAACRPSTVRPRAGSPATKRTSMVRSQATTADRSKISCPPESISMSPLLPMPRLCRRLPLT